ncbi:enoyl-CoA hydratase/isomerase family protein [Haloferax marisrubri]|uniref:Enoyl-CoA hydratase/isomerase family protein n=1 Tax=Haloferax marisrubri TaxID=1544719 RepID=A0A2P4NLX5_9EURY|nr:enoyl-CoA hydratase/isomerase family protein [Haloferax marisrubri]POG54163.1 enoyl-CoA hydratase/isomerase family protein [Haloferax marisrubri]
MSDELTYEVEGEIGVITITRPDSLNALNTSVNEQIRDALESFESADVRAVLIESSGDRAFVAGADLKEIHGMSVDEFISYQKNGRRTNDAIAAHPKPVIAVVDGLAYGGGFEVALAADMVVSTPDAKFALPEAKLGLLPGGGGTQRLTRIAGTNATKELLMTGEPIDGERAHQLGIVNRLADDPSREARELADELTATGPLATAAAKELVDEGIQAPLDTALTLEQEVTFTLYGSDDTSEGIEAFVESRTPEFTGE